MEQQKQCKTITEVTRQFHISTRTLRYYEQIALIRSEKLPDYAYRVYDAENVAMIKNILVLKKLRIPLKDIGKILKDRNTAAAVDIFMRNFQSVSSQLDALSSIKKILAGLIDALQKAEALSVKIDIFQDKSLLNLMDYYETIEKETSIMHELNAASKKLDKLFDVRVIYFPPGYLASAHCMGEDSEPAATEQIMRFLRSSGLAARKPDIRMFGFNNPAGPPPVATGYELCVTIPEDTVVMPPLVKKYFRGGMYAAHMIPFGAFDHWPLLHNWVMEHAAYRPDLEPRIEPGGPGADIAFEEQLNCIYNWEHQTPVEQLQLDLLFPVKSKNTALEP